MFDKSGTFSILIKMMKIFLKDFINIRTQHLTKHLFCAHSDLLGCGRGIEIRMRLDKIPKKDISKTIP